MCRKAWGKLIRSLAFEAATSDGKVPENPLGAAWALMEVTKLAEMEEAPTPGTGREIRIVGEGVDGSALLLDDELVHCTLYAGGSLV